jgi:hypothetical protein
MNANHIVSVNADPDTGKAVCTPDKVLTSIDDTIQWFSDEGPHEGQIIDPQGTPFEGGVLTWDGKENEGSQRRKVVKRGVFKYRVQVTKNGKVFENDPEVIGT